MKLYHTQIAPNARRARIFIAEKGLTDHVELITVKLGEGEHKSAEFLAKNPYATVPVLELDDGSYITESHSISRYFETVKSENKLFGESAQEQALVDMWQRRAELGVLFSTANYFHHATEGIGDDRYRNKDWGLHQQKKLPQHLKIINAQLSKNKFLAGKHYSIADITLFCALDFALHLDLLDLNDYPHLLRWHQEISQRPSSAA